MTGQALAEVAGDSLAVLVALVGWVVHVRLCREQLAALREENRQLVEALARVAELAR